MKPISELSLCFEMPVFECESGWHPIINSVLICIDRHLRKMPERSGDSKFSIDQVKQKLGGLRIYCNNSDSYIDGVIDLAEIMAYNTCEVTGEKGFLHHNQGYMQVLSPKMAEQLGFVPAGKDHRSIHVAKKKSISP